MATLKEHYNIVDDGASNDGEGTVKDTVWYAQIFTASSSYSLTSVKLLLRRFAGTSPGTVTVSIRAVSGNLPTGGDLAIGTTNGNTLTESTSGEWREITFVSPLSVTSGTSYAIVVRTLDVSSYYLRWRTDYTSPSYAGGRVCNSTNSGSSWTGFDSVDLLFETYEEIAEYVELTGTIAGTSALSADLTVGTFVDLIGTIEAEGDMSAILLAHVNVQALSFKKRLIVAGNNQIWYEDQ